MSVGSKVRKLRQRRGWTQRHLAEQAGDVTNQTISNIERELHQPSLALATRLARAFGVPLDELTRNGQAKRRA